MAESGKSFGTSMPQLVNASWDKYFATVYCVLGMLKIANSKLLTDLHPLQEFVIEGRLFHQVDEGRVVQVEGELAPTRIDRIVDGMEILLSCGPLFPHLLGVKVHP